jgi:CRISPR/Cas system-associated exonuclease Cas4 (RecB family)
VERDPSWITATDLAEYAYCPRALHYRRRFPTDPDPPEAIAGRKFHRRVLTAESRRAARRGSYWAGVLLGSALVALGLSWSVVR